MMRRCFGALCAVAVHHQYQQQQQQYFVCASNNNNINNNAYRLTYYPGRGTAEHIRMLLAEAGISYEDVRLKGAQVDQLIKKNLLPYKQVPYLESLQQGFALSNSNAIARYLAKKHGYMGKGPQDEALIDEVMEYCAELRFSYQRLSKEPDATRKTMMVNYYYYETVPPVLQQFSKRIKGPFLLGDKPCIADFTFYCLLESITQQRDDVVNDFPEIIKFQESIKTLPRIKAWIEQRPKTAY